MTLFNPRRCRYRNSHMDKATEKRAIEQVTSRNRERGKNQIKPPALGRAVKV